MKIKESDKKVYQAMDLIIAKGGQQLYNSYIKQKLPKHNYQSITKTIQSFFNPLYANATQKQKITKPSKPASIKKDEYTPNKVSRRYKASEVETSQSKTRVRYKSENFDSSLRNSKVINSSCKPNICIKFMCRKVDDNYEQQMQMRNKKQRQIQKKQEQENQRRINDLNTRERQKDIRNTMNELNQMEIPITYDDEGKVIVPQQFLQQDEKEREKKMKQLRNRKQLEKEEFSKTDIIDLKFETIGCDSRQLTDKKTKNLIGRKKGFSSGKYYKKVKLSDRDFNNNHQRQYSTIPFLNLSEGVKLVEKQKNITASKTKETQCTRTQYVRENKKSFFKSYLPDSDYISAISMSASRNRPLTADNYRTKKTIQTKSGHETKRSILWRPSTSRKERDKICVKNEELAKQITYL